jgi:hypothetical protein
MGRKPATPLDRAYVVVAAEQDIRFHTRMSRNEAKIMSDFDKPVYRISMLQ